MSDPGSPPGSPPGNDLGAGAQPPAAPAAVPDGHDPLLATVKQAHSQAKAQVDKLAEAKAMTDHIRTELDNLSAMGDNVTEEDVIKGAGNIIGQGGDPMQMAGLLADMPQGGQALSAWLKDHAAALTANEQKLDQALGSARHSAGVAALHLVAMHHIGEQFKAAAMGAPANGRLN